MCLQDINKVFKVFIIVVVIFLFCYCNKGNPVKKYYYDTGELKAEVQLIKIDANGDSIFFNKDYNKQGYVVAEGHDKEGVCFGFWKFYYSDGKLEWRGEMKNGHRYIPDSILFNNYKQPTDIEIEGHPKTLEVGQEYKLRTYVEGLPLDAYIVTNSNFDELERNDIDPEKYPLKFTPKRAGKLNILIVFPDSNGYVIYGEAKVKVFTFSVKNPR